MKPRCDQLSEVYSYACASERISRMLIDRRDESVSYVKYRKESGPMTKYAKSLEEEVEILNELIQLLAL